MGHVGRHALRAPHDHAAALVLHLPVRGTFFARTHPERQRQHVTSARSRWISKYPPLQPGEIRACEASKVLPRHC